MNNFVVLVQDWSGGGRYSIFLFPFLVGLLLFCSLRIVKYSLIIVNKTKFGAGFFGSSIIALVTSLPELITEITQAQTGYPQNGLGDDIGSNAFSTFLIAIAAFLFIKKSFLNNLSKWAKISIFLSFVMALTLTIGLAFVGRDLKLGIIGIIPLVMFCLYLITFFLSTKLGDENLKEKQPQNNNISTGKASWLFLFFSLGVVLFSILINVNVSAFQRDYKIKSDSIGGIVLAMVTSLPEVIAFFAFLRKNELTMGITSLTGSHFFNLGITFFGDLAYHHGPSFNKTEMTEQLPVAILNTILIFLLIVHFTFANRLKIYAKNKLVYLIIPFIIIISYVVGWILILLLN